MCDHLGEVIPAARRRREGRPGNQFGSFAAQQGRCDSSLGEDGTSGGKQTAQKDLQEAKVNSI